MRATTRYGYTMTSPKFNTYLISILEKTAKLVSVIKYYTRESRVIFTFFPDSSHFLRLLPINIMSEKIRVQSWVFYLFIISRTLSTEKFRAY